MGIVGDFAWFGEVISGAKRCNVMYVFGQEQKVGRARGCFCIWKRGAGLGLIVLSIAIHSQSEGTE